MSDRNLIEVDPRCGIGSSCRLIGSSDRNFPSESSQFSLTRPTMLIAKTCRGSNFLSNVVRLSPALSGEAGTLAVPQTLPPPVGAYCASCGVRAFRLSGTRIYSGTVPRALAFNSALTRPC